MAVPRGEALVLLPETLHHLLVLGEKLAVLKLLLEYALNHFH